MDDDKEKYDVWFKKGFLVRELMSDNFEIERLNNLFIGAEESEQRFLSALLTVARDYQIPMDELKSFNIENRKERMEIILNFLSGFYSAGYPNFCRYGGGCSV